MLECSKQLSVNFIPKSLTELTFSSAWVRPQCGSSCTSILAFRGVSGSNLRRSTSYYDWLSLGFLQPVCHTVMYSFQFFFFCKFFHSVILLSMLNSLMIDDTIITRIAFHFIYIRTFLENYMLDNLIPLHQKPAFQLIWSNGPLVFDYSRIKYFRSDLN